MATFMIISPNLGFFPPLVSSQNIFQRGFPYILRSKNWIKSYKNGLRTFAEEVGEKLKRINLRSSLASQNEEAETKIILKFFGLKFATASS